MEEEEPDSEPGEPMVCRLCLSPSTQCLSFSSDSVKTLTDCLPVHIRATDPPVLSGWICPACLKKMRLCRQFFSQVLTSYDRTVGSFGLTNFVKADMISCLNKEEEEEEDLVKQEMEEVCEQKAEETLNGVELEESWDWKDDSTYIKDNDSPDPDESEEEVVKKKKSKTVKTSRSGQGKRKRDKTEEDDSVGGGKGGLLVMRKRREKHIKIISLPTMCTCSLCGLQSATHLANQDHWRSSHPQEELVYTCNEDEDDCNYSTPDLQSMKNHLREHLVKLGKIGQCEVCSKYFPKNYLSHHVRLVHELQKTFECKTCQKRFKTERILRTHEFIHEPDDARYRFSCHVCGQRFTQRGNLDTHLKNHMGLKPYKCGSCEKAFTTSSGLKAHSLVHTGERPFLCDSCDATFKSSSQLKTHVMEKHLNIHRYQCSYCPVKYNRLELLRNHEMSHTGETPHKCSTCGKGFRRKDKLRIHEILHGPEETKYRFPCEVCGKRFTQNNNLKTHIKSHHSEPRSPESSQPTPPPPALPLLPLTSTFSSFPGPGIHWPANRL